MSENKKRFLEIISIVKKYDVQNGLTPLKLRQILEELGPTFVKIGQIMATRNDMLPEAFCSELLKLQEAVEPLSFEVIETILNNEFNDYHNIFLKIDPVPLGSGSIAQVHKAVLKEDNQQVVIKVQRPHIYELMKRDVTLLKKIINKFNLNRIIGNVVDLDSILDEFWNIAQEEMNFEIEGNNILEFYNNFNDIPFIKIPVYYKAFSTSKVLVMEYIGGTNISNIKVLENEGYDIKEIVDKLSYNYINQVVEYGRFHADPHSGNIKIIKGKIAWIDFGMIGSLSKSNQNSIKQGIVALVNKDVVQVCDIILRIGIHGNIDYPMFLEDIDRIINEYLELEIKNISISALIKDIFDVCHKHRISMPKDITMLARGMIVFESTITTLDSSVNVLELIAKYVVQNKNNIDLKQGLTNLGASTTKLVELPVQFNQLLKMLIKGQVKVNLNVLGSEEPLYALDKMVNRIVIVIFASALLLGSSLICTTDMEPKIFSIPAIGFFGYVCAIILGIWLFLRIIKTNRKK